jgi:hypothetical protein
VRPPRWPFEPCRRADEQESGCGHKMPFESHPTLVSIQSSPYFGSRGNGDEGTDGFGIGGRVLDRSGGTGRGAAEDRLELHDLVSRSEDVSALSDLGWPALVSHGREG